MAYSVVETHIANPARGRRKAKKNMAKTKKRRNLSAKQIRAGFGGARRKAALKTKRKAKAHRPRTKPKANPARHYKKKASASRPRPRKKKSTSSRRPRTKRNPELVSFLLGNPAKRSKKKMATHKHKKKRAASHRNAGRPRKKKSVSRRRRGNPSSIGTPKRWLEWGAGGVVGFVGSAALPQLLAPSSNTGMTGYALSLGATIGLGLLSHMVLKRPDVTVGVMVGGLSNLLRRVITDQTPYGSYLNAPQSQGGMGMGDYMVANWGPVRMQDGLHSAMAEAPGTPWTGNGMVTSTYGVNTQDLADMRSSRPC